MSNFIINNLMPETKSTYKLELKNKPNGFLTIYMVLGVECYEQLLNFFSMKDNVDNYKIHKAPTKLYKEILNKIQPTINKIIKTTKAYKTFSHFKFMADEIELITIQRQDDKIITTIRIKGLWYGKPPTQN